MYTYLVTISYTITTDGTTSTSQTIAFRRKANDRATAISVATALFGRLSNYYFELDGHRVPSINIVAVGATDVTNE